MDSSGWDERYSGSDLVWSAGPNLFVEQVCADLTPTTAIDLGAGEGRNALWLAERGWQATAVDFSGVALDRARQIAAERLGDHADRLTTVQADLTAFTPQTMYDLVLVVYLQVPPADRASLLVTAARCTAPGGRLLVVAHHSDNLTEGVGGPQHPDVLYTEKDVLADLARELDGGRLTVERAERALRAVDGDRTAVDTVVLLRRPSG